MKKTLAVCAALVALAIAGPAYGQATRTWVSGVGDDVNPCSRTAPCKTFAGAISKTAAGGEINCLDPGGFGTLTITKSLTIDCTGTFGSVLNSGGINGIVVNDSATLSPGTIRVIIRGIAINGAGATAGLNGIRFISGRSLVVENVAIQNQSSRGILFQPAQASRLSVTNSTIINANGGVMVQPTGAAGNGRVLLDNVRLMENTGDVVRVETNGNTNPSPTLVDINNSVMSGGFHGLIVVTSAGTSAATVNINNSVVDHNTAGLLATGPTSIIRAAGNLITVNLTGVSAAGGGQVISYQNNRTQGNPSTFTSTTNEN
ncbi:MAG TPA: hypothetical protein VF582_02050 [Allosphingosinicella sp.]|jgi:hypothetical protein